MIVVVASRHDRAAATLVARWGADAAVLLTAEDLSVSGWRQYVAAAGTPAAVIGGREMALAEIIGVVTRLPSVSELDLLYIVPADRAYVAAEMTAFLLTWLSGLPCPVVNRPTPTCLSGPYWRPEQWAYVAAQVGMRVQPVHRRVTPAVDVGPTVTDGRVVIVVGERCLGDADATLQAQARRLARTAGADLLAVRFNGAGPDATFVSADPWPDLTADATAEALREFMEGRTA